MDEHTTPRAGRSTSLRHALLLGAVVATGLLAPATASASVGADKPPVGPAAGGDIGIEVPCDVGLEPCGPGPDEPECNPLLASCDVKPGGNGPDDPCEGDEPPEDCGGPGGGGEPGGGEPEPGESVDPTVRATPNFTG